MEGLTLERLQVIIDANTRGIREELARVQSAVRQTTSSTQRQTGRISSSFSHMGKMVVGALSTVAIVSFGKKCIELGSDLQEVQNVVDVTFGKMNEDINAFAKNAISQFGLSELSAKQYTSTMGTMLKSMGITSDEMLVMSKNLTGLAGDMASFYNLSGDEAFSKIRAGISGETEPLKQLGINMSVANLEAYALSQGITKAYSEMEQAEQVLLRYNYLMQVTADAQGDFARTSDSWANQTKILSESFNSVKATIGQGLINVFTPVLKLINELIPKLQTVANMFKEFTAAIFGDSGGGSDNINEAAVSAGELSANMDDTAVAVNATKKALSGLDKLNNISSNDTKSSGEANIGMATQTVTFDTSSIDAIPTKVDGASSKIKNIFNSLSTYIKNVFYLPFRTISREGQKSFERIKDTAKKTWKTISDLKTPLKEWFKDDVTKYFKNHYGQVSKILAKITSLFTTVFIDIWERVILPVFEKFITVGLPMITQFGTEMTVAVGLLCQEVLGVVSLLWTEGIAPLLDTVTTVWADVMDILSDTWAKYGEPIFDGIRECIRGTVDVFTEAWKKWIKPIWDGFVDLIDKLWSQHLKPVVAKIGDFVGEFILAAETIYNEFILPIISFVSDILGPKIKNAFKGIYDVVGPILGGIADAIGGIIDALKGVCKFITGVFSGDWKKAWNGLKDVFKGIWDALVGIVKVPLNLIIGLVNKMIGAVESAANFIVDGVNLLSFEVPDWVPGIGGETFGFDLSPVSFTRIQYLAKGGIVNSATPAIIGEAGKEAVLPLENNTGWMDVLVKRIAAYNNNNRLYDAVCYLADKIGDGNIYVKVEMDGDVVYEKIEARRQQFYKMTAGYA